MYPYHFRYARGPRRLFWFVLGGAATAWWFRAQERKGPRFTIEGTPTNADSYPERHWGWGRRDQSLDGAKWEAERERIQRLRHEASETMIDVTEASLDSVLSAVDVLKRKLAEQRSGTRQPPAKGNDSPPPA
ncbi:hypothetical protein BOTBODRAFT_31776 [Botryobasidium botryosum FD-172 SS1]|uniref:Uncharacterized protein n=1 Tax=Botryobasidium botryosum (strain FD-172 SS1) TaxID=930990 RepID=A0A067ML54_BOTB1|nr:hypothetical protein BOTBODRAFT_31776 [Botryobasidium botryosum FD-172 SS1]